MGNKPPFGDKTSDLLKNLGTTVLHNPGFVAADIGSSLILQRKMAGMPNAFRIKGADGQTLSPAAFSEVAELASVFKNPNVSVAAKKMIADGLLQVSMAEGADTIYETVDGVTLKIEKVDGGVHTSISGDGIEANVSAPAEEMIGALFGIRDGLKHGGGPTIMEAELDGLIERKERILEASREIREWMMGGYRLERAVGSVKHRLIDDYVANKVLMLRSGTVFRDEADSDVLQASSSFVIEHDWAGAFDKATEFGNDYKLPYDSCCFEFKISGKRVCVFIGRDHGGDECLIFFVETKRCWVLPQYVYDKKENGWVCKRHANEIDAFGSLKDLLTKNIRAICIALDAEVAQSNVVRANYKMNRSRERRGKLPTTDYHVVSLTRRTRAATLPDEYAGGDDERRNSPRLHFRRGHWRHFDNHKSWIKWQLVGDPDLGWIDKHYKL